MFAILFVSLLAACAAAPSPRFHHRDHDAFSFGLPFHQQPQQDPGFAPRPSHYDPFADDVFDTRQFWTEMANELRQLDEMLAEFQKNFPSTSATQGVQGNQYKITIPLNGYDEKDIIVKAREGVLMVQAVHKMEGVTGSERSYLDIKTLPPCVNVNGTWNFEDNVLKVVFPLKSDVETEDVTELVSESPVTEAYSREEMAPTGDVEGDADVGAHGDEDLNKQLFTNEIPRNSVEATTYAVDLKDEVEFVPVRYR